MDFDEDFQKLDAMMSSYELEGESAPLKLGEQAFSWEAVIELSEKLLERGADLRVAIWWIRALAVENKFDSMVLAFERIEQWVRSDMPDLYPLPEEGESRAEAIALNLSWLGTEKFLSTFQRVKIDDETEIQQLKNSPGKMDLNEGLKDRLTRMLTSLSYLNDFMQAIEAEQMYDISLVVTYVSSLFSQKQEPIHPEEGVTHQSKNHVSDIRTRDDVATVIRSLIKYFQESEPGHPAPILLERVQRMLGASFQDILKELYQDAPQLVSRIERPQGN
jgi:type VI secretion system protein ImpA